MSMYSVIEECNELIQDQLSNMKVVKPTDIGLDYRAGYKLWIDNDCIVINKQNDNSLQYYGGFEYVDKSCRVEFDDYVIYFGDDDRVREHLEYVTEE